MLYATREERNHCQSAGKVAAVRPSICGVAFRTWHVRQRAPRKCFALRSPLKLITLNELPRYPSARTILRTSTCIMYIHRDAGNRGQARQVERNMVEGRRWWWPSARLLDFTFVQDHRKTVARLEWR